ncbi:MAG: long-chain fatty acid--CoA ligase [Gemmatimonadota bacterium]|nr:MAG: long-chain fatty acid--CoA ligase [Gemmatimonadota bacterium]
MTPQRTNPTLRTVGAPAIDMPTGNIAQLFLGAIDRYGKPDALKYKKAGAWHNISHRKLYEDVKRAALGLQALGIAAGERVAILSENRPEWLLSDFACVMSGTVSVPLYPVLPADQITYMLRDSEARAVFVSTEQQLQKVREARAGVAALERIIVYDEALEGEPDVLSLKQLLELGAANEPGHPDAKYRARALASDPDDILTILYTSGTTGRPKGVMLTHNNLNSNVRACLQLLDLGPEDVSLSVLPLSHVFERMAGQYTLFSVGATICYAESFQAVVQNMVEVRPTVMPMVPRGYEKIYAGVEETARAGGAAKHGVLRWAIRVGGKRLDRRMAGKKVGPWLAAQYAVADRLVFSKLRSEMGGRIRFFFSGAAPLSADLARFYLSAGLTIIEGYGLTETSPVITLNRPGRIKLGTVGEPIPGVEVAIAEDGEILTRGPHVMKGYYENPEATAAAIDAEDWFHTGDIGELDEQGYLSITDRKKDLIVTPGGKNIAPQPIENRVQCNPYVSQVVMIGDRRKFPVLLIVPDFAAVESWARAQQIEFASREALVGDERVKGFMEREILNSLSGFARFEQPKKIALLPHEFTIGSGEITPTLKVKRRVIETKYKEIIDSLYAED